MLVDTPYLVTRGSAALCLVRGDRVRVDSIGVLVQSTGVRRNDWRGYLLMVELDRGGCLEEIAVHEREAERLRGLLG
jgi:hypothetical protein